MKNKFDFDITLQCQEILKYASVFDNNKYLTGDSVIYGIYRFFKFNEDLANILWKYLGVSEGLLDNYFSAIGNISDLIDDVIIKSFDPKLNNLLKQFSNDQIDIQHLLYVGFKTSDKFVLFLQINKINIEKVLNKIKFLIDKLKGKEIDFYLFLELLYGTMNIANIPENKIEKFIKNVSVDAMVNEQVVSRLSDSMIQDDDMQSDIDTQENKNNQGEKKLTIQYFGIDLTDEAKKGLLDPVIGRDKEIRQVIYTLLRKTKNNPLLIGEAGVGKTAIVEGLAQLIAKGEVPERLKNKRIFALDMGSLVAGTKYRGEFESRLKTILEEASDPTNNIILFIDEIHTILGAGNAEGSLDAANMLKPLLSRGKIQLIGATTFDEYQKYIEKDPALKRRFQEIIVEEPSLEDAINILKGLRSKFEEYHGVIITDEAIKAAVELSNRYILNKHLPDKAIDLIDEASARHSTLIEKLKNDQDYKKIEKEIEKIQNQIEKAINVQDYFKAAELKQKEEELKIKLKNYRVENTLPPDLRPKITAEDIGNVLAEKLGIPENKINQSEVEKLANLEEVLKSKLLGQEEVIEKVVSAIQRNRLSVVKKHKPIASFLFLGPSGVGKTYLAKLLATEFFGDDKALIRVDMSELMEKHSVSKLIGSAPGYVGYEEGGMLTEAVRRKPYSVVLFDEIEKASPEVLNILLQILDEGYVKDNKGRMIDFKNTIIILTSNIGSEEFGKEVPKIGFITEQEKKQEDQKFESIKERVLEKLKELLSPELLNRLDYIVVFRPLSKEILKQIFKNKIKEYLSHWKDRQKEGLKLPKFTDQKIEKIIDQIYKPEFGARPIDRYIHDEVETTLIKQLLKLKTKK